MHSDKKHKILCVDDEPANLKLLEAILSPKGYDLAFAKNGSMALEIVSKNPPDIVLLDIMMQGMSGYEVLEKLRGDENTRLIPVVMITALHETEDRIKAIDAGCDDFISKPFDKNEVLARVKALLKISYYRSLLDEKEKFEYLMENIEDGIAVLDNSYKLARLNKKTKSLLSLSDNDLGADFFTLLNKFNLPYAGDLKVDLKARPLAFDIERPETDNFKSLIVEAHSSPIVNPAGEIDNILITLHDVSAVRKEEILKQDFLRLISHKLRTPTAVIMQTALMLQEGTLGDLGEKPKKFIDSLVRESLGLRALVENLINFTTINSSDFSLSKGTIEIQSYLPKVVEVIVKTAKEKKVEFEIDCPDKDMVMHMYRVYFDQMIGNLVDNAIKFNDKETVKIRISARKSADEIQISISDNGPGIPPEEQEKVFEKFYQIEKYFTGQVKGAGLGLALVKRIVAAYGGKVSLESEIDKGAKFTVSLPLA